ncbi:uncharacterized transmembrane protein DDB_G0289901 isoform X2 [Coccinella septempunctata]|uniref:uncharacterized transmembrane protein DDB_G0289901 isoform X2 n=1 Tax=Coccinella septempunctata TaxID=41139 RepID=UPI001D07AE23|nr:uncharacterized transmembrane protein DDB_G0289901 isoform X2 [Coccinella septempunctata]
MSRATYIGFFAYYLLVGFIDSSEGYGTKGGHQSFSQSYSSSSAAAHSSSFSSSGSYSFGDKSVLPIVGPIPIAQSSAVASASAGAASAVAGAIAGAATGKNTAAGSSVVFSGKENHGANTEYGHYKVGGNEGSKASTLSPSAGYGQTHVISSGASSATAQTSTSGGSFTSHTTAIVPGSSDEGRESDDKQVIRVPCCKTIYPGPDGSIYDYKDAPISQTPGIPGYGSSVTNSGSHEGSNTGYGQVSTGSSSYGGVSQQTPGLNGTPSRKPCCKGPFPGPNGSIYDSKPASAVGTAVKPDGSQVTSKPSLPLHRPPVNFPGPSGSIYTSKPANSVGTPGSGSYSSGPTDYNKPSTSYKPSGGSYQLPSPGISSSTIAKPVGGYPSTGPSSVVVSKPAGQITGQYGHQTNTQTSSSGANSYQTEYQASTTCNTGNCNKQPPRTYLQPPQNELKPVNEPAQEQPSSSTLPQSGYSGVKPQIQTVSTSVKPGTSGYQVSSINSGYNTGNSGSGYQPTPSSGNNVPIGPGSNQYQPQQTTVTGTGVQKGVYQGGFSASSATAGVSSSSSGYSAVGGIHKTYDHGSVQKPSVTIIDDTQRNENDDKISYVSGPGSPSYTTGNAANYYPSVTENTIKGSGLIEGPRGSPLIPHSYPKHETKTSGYDEPERDSAIVFVDGHGGSGGYSTGRGYASSGTSFSGSSVGGSNILYSGSKDSSKKPSGTYVSTIHVDFNKPSGSSQGTFVGGSGTSGQGVILVGTSSSDDSKPIGGNSGSYGYIGSSLGHKGVKQSGHVQETYVGGSGTSGQGVILVGTSSSDNSKPIGGNSGSYGYIGSSVGNKDAKPSGHVQGTYVSGSTGQGVISVGHNSQLTGGNAGSYGYIGNSVSHGGSLKKPSGYGQGTFVGGTGTTGQGVISIGTSSIGNSGSYGYSAGSVGHAGIPCTSNGCGTSYRQYSNAVPSSGTKNVAVHITSVPSGSYGKTGGSYGGGLISTSAKGGSASGSYGAASASSGSGANGGGFLSSIFLDDGTATNAGSHSKAGGYSHSSSFAKASSFASSSSFSSASSGSYSSGHY